MGWSCLSSNVVTLWACLSQRRVNFTSPSTKPTAALLGTPFQQTAHSTLWSTFAVTLHRSAQIGQHWSWVSKTMLIWSNTSSMSTDRILSISFSEKVNFLLRKMLNRNLEQVNTQKGSVAFLLLKVSCQNAPQARPCLKSVFTRTL